MGHWERPQLIPESPGQHSEPHLAREGAQPATTEPRTRPWGGGVTKGPWPQSPALRAGSVGCGEVPQHPTLHGGPLKTGRAGLGQAGGGGVDQAERPARQWRGPQPSTPHAAQGQALCLGAHRPRDTGGTEHRADGPRAGDAGPPAGPDTAWEGEPLSRCLRDAIRRRQTKGMVRAQHIQGHSADTSVEPGFDPQSPCLSASQETGSPGRLLSEGVGWFSVRGWVGKRWRMWLAVEAWAQPGPTAVRAAPGS